MPAFAREYSQCGLTKRRRADGPNDGSVRPDHPSSGPSVRRLIVRLAERRATRRNWVNIIISPRRTDPRLYYQSAQTDFKLYCQSGKKTIANTNPNPEL